MNSKITKKKAAIYKNNEVEKIFKTGQIFQNKLFLIGFCKSEQNKVWFLTQKIEKAVDRNRLKRRLRVLYSKFYKDFNLTGKIILLIKKQALGCHFKKLEEEFYSLLKNVFSLKDTIEETKP